MILARVTSNPCAAANNRAPGALMERPSVKEEITSVVNLNVCVQPRRDPLEAVAPQTIPSVMPMAMPMVILPAIVPKIIPTPAPIAIPTPVQSSCAPPRVPVVISPTRPYSGRPQRSMLVSRHAERQSRKSRAAPLPPVPQQESNAVEVWCGRRCRQKLDVAGRSMWRDLSADETRVHRESIRAYVHHGEL